MTAGQFRLMNLKLTHIKCQLEEEDQDTSERKAELQEELKMRWKQSEDHAKIFFRGDDHDKMAETLSITSFLYGRVPGNRGQASNNGRESLRAIITTIA
ncbi:hypothetical protein Trydic_g8028 [Trypoxylus dichotomus]